MRLGSASSCGDEPTVRSFVGRVLDEAAYEVTLASDRGFVMKTLLCALCEVRQGTNVNFASPYTALTQPRIEPWLGRPRALMRT